MSSAGIYGGNFDPVHIGHLITAQRILELRKLDKIIFVPAHISPFKQDIRSTPPADRFNMLTEAVRGIPSFEISDYEIRKKGVSYSVDTVRHFKQKFDHLDLIIGLDNLIEFTEWKDPDEIVKMADLVILKRTTSENELRENRFFKNAVFPDTPLLEISSTEIRNRIREKRTIDFLTPEVVKEYIIKNNLYRE